MNKKTERKVKRIEGEMAKREAGINEILAKMEDMLKEVKKRGLNNSDDHYTVGCNLASAGIRIVQETLHNCRLSMELVAATTKIVKVQSGEEAKKLVDEHNKKNGKEEAMSGCKDGKKKPSGKKCCGGKKCK